MVFMNKELISIIVPCYNQGRYLEECLISIFNQTYLNWECIIVNDGSTDETKDVACKWIEKDKRFKYVEKLNAGLSAARNTGLVQSSGNWIQFLDCDDILENQKLECSSNYFNSNYDIIISGYRYFKNSEGPNIKRIYGINNFLPEVGLYSDDDVDLKNLIVNRNLFVVSAPIYKRKVFDILGGFNIYLKAQEDWEFNLRCVFKNFKFFHVGYFLNTRVLIRLHQVSMSQNKKLMHDNWIQFRKIISENPDVKYYFRNNNIKNSSRSVKDILQLFIPPILLIVLKKFFKN